MAEITITIDESGDLKMLETAMAEPFKTLGTTVTKRASYVEPAPYWDRVLFTFIRALVPDDSRLAEWTRNWNTLWRVNMKPVGGPILRWKHVAPSKCAAWMDDQIFTTYYRQEAIDEEIKFLNDFWRNQ